MIQYGKAFKTIRLIKDIREGEAAEALGIDKRTLYDIESCKTALVSERFEQMLKYYKTSLQVVTDLAKDPSTFHNVINNSKRDAIVVNQGQIPYERDKEISDLRAIIEDLKEQDKFRKMEIERLLNLVEQLLSNQNNK